MEGAYMLSRLPRSSICSNLRPTVGRLVLLVLIGEGILFLLERLHWLAIGNMKGWPVLTAVGGVGAAICLMLLWFAACLAFRLRFQFTVRSLFGLTLAAAMACSWLTAEIRRAEKQRAAAEVIWKYGAIDIGGHVFYDYRLTDPTGKFVRDKSAPGKFVEGPLDTAGRVTYPEPTGPRWLRKLLGDDFFSNVVEVHIFTRPPNLLAAVEMLTELRSLYCYDQFTDDDLLHFRGLKQLRTLKVEGRGVTDNGLKNLTTLTNLEVLDLGGTSISDAGCAHLACLRKLRSLSLDCTKVTDVGLEHLKGLVDLESLSLSDTHITGTGLENLKGLTQLHELSLDGTPLGDADLEHLKGLTNLQDCLILSRTRITDAGLKHLQTLARLESLVLYNTAVTPAGVEGLQRLLPTCEISWGKDEWPNFYSPPHEKTEEETGE